MEPHNAVDLSANAVNPSANAYSLGSFYFDKLCRDLNAEEIGDELVETGNWEAFVVRNPSIYLLFGLKDISGKRTLLAFHIPNKES